VPRRRKVVCIGGGTGQAQILRALSAHPLDLTSIVGVTDDGGHSGMLRRALGIPQVGDIRNCLASLADDRLPLARLLRYRFPGGEMEGTSLGNLIVAAMIDVRGSLSAAVEALGEELGVKARIYPVSDRSTQICAKLEDGRTIAGEWKIIGRRPRSPIRRLFHRPKVDAHPGAVRAIRRADLVVFCPGSLQTGIVSALLPRGVVEAVRVSSAVKAQVCNIMTQPGNTDGFTARDHLDLLARYLGSPPDVFLVNTKRPPASWLGPYRRDGAEPVRDDVGRIPDVRVVRRSFLEPAGKDVLKLYRRAGRGPGAGPHFIRHDPRRVGAALRSLL
jgi:uncharacterized cofD-like protein